MTVFIDTNVLIAIVNPHEPHHDWSVQTLNDQLAVGPALISDIVFCEFSVAMENVDEASASVASLGLERLRTNDAALFRAGKAFKKYRENAGIKTNVLPDFLIGAEAVALDVPLVTANEDDFVKYFPELKIISP
jgi:predicted nucleic acid-binding protein